MWADGFCKAQEAVELAADDMLHNVEIELVVLVDGDVAKSDHRSESIGLPRVNQALARQHLECILALGWYPEALFADQHIGQVDIVDVIGINCRQAFQRPGECSLQASEYSDFSCSSCCCRVSRPVTAGLP